MICDKSATSVLQVFGEVVNQYDQRSQCRILNCSQGVQDRPSDSSLESVGIFPHAETLMRMLCGCEGLLYPLIFQINRFHHLLSSVRDAFEHSAGDCKDALHPCHGLVDISFGELVVDCLDPVIHGGDLFSVLLFQDTKLDSSAWKRARKSSGSLTRIKDD